MPSDPEAIKTVATVATLVERVAWLVEKQEAADKSAENWRAALTSRIEEVSKQISAYLDSYREHVHQAADRDRRISSLEQDVKEMKVDILTRGKSIDDRMGELVPKAFFKNGWQLAIQGGTLLVSAIGALKAFRII